MIPPSPKTSAALLLALSFASSPALAHGTPGAHQHTTGTISLIEAKLAPGEKIRHIVLSDDVNWSASVLRDETLLMKAYRPNTCAQVAVQGDRGTLSRSWVCRQH